MDKILLAQKLMQEGMDETKTLQDSMKALSKHSEMKGGIALAVSSLNISEHAQYLKIIAQQIKAFMRGQQITEVSMKLKSSYKTNFCVASIVASMRIYQDYRLYSQNVITGKELAKKIVRHGVTLAATSTASYGGMIGGAKVGTMIYPGAGTIIGGLVGGLFAGLLAEEFTTRTCKYVMDEKEYQLDVIQDEYTKNMEALQQSYLQALMRRCLTKNSTDIQVKASKKKDLLELSPDKNPHLRNDEGTKAYAMVISDYEIIKGFRKLIAGYSQ